MKQMPIPHASRNNYFLEPIWSLNYFIIPWGALILALPSIFSRGLREPRLRPLLLGFWLTMIFAMGGTTPLPRLLLGRAFEVVTFERFSFWANLMALPIVGLLAVQLIDRYGQKAMLGLSALAGMIMAMAVAWSLSHPMHDLGFSTSEAISFLYPDRHDRYRY